jgi:hypothetical protein
MLYYNYNIFEAALYIVKAKKLHAMAEVLVLQSAADMVETVLGEHIVTKMHVIPLSYNIISH